MFTFFTFSRLGRTALAKIDPKTCFFTLFNSALIVNPPFPKIPPHAAPCSFLSILYYSVLRAVKILIYLPERCSQGAVRRRWDFAELLDYDWTRRVGLDGWEWEGFPADFGDVPLPIGRTFPLILTLKAEAKLTGIILVQLWEYNCSRWVMDYREWGYCQ